MIMAIGWDSKIDRNQRFEGYDDSEVDYNLLKELSLGLYILLNLNVY